MSDYFQRHIPAGESLNLWLSWGPLYQDLSEQVVGLSLFEVIGATVGKTAMNEIVAEASQVMTGRYREGDVFSFRGHSAQWQYVRRPDLYMSWGTYNISNHLGAVFLSAIITPDEAGIRQWTFNSIMAEQAVVAINGQVVWDNGPLLDGRKPGGVEYAFEAALQPGENVVTVGLFRLARMAQVGCFLSVDTDVQACVEPGLDLEDRTAIERSVHSVRLERDIFYPDHEISIEMAMPPAAYKVKAQLVTSEDGRVKDGVAGSVVLREGVYSDGRMRFGKGADIAEGIYQIACEWQDAEGQPVTATIYEVRIVNPVAPMPGYDLMEERKQIALEYYTHETGGDRPIWAAVAAYALGQEVDESLIRKVCEFIAARKDCSDFVIQGVLRIMFWERKQQRLSPQINALMKDTVLGFKYWVDEPGDTVMYMGSENHRLLFHVAEWMAGTLFPTEEFTNSGQRGLFHALKGQYYIAEWLRQRGRFGFNEWHSNSYYPICVAPLLNVYDFSTVEHNKLLTIGTMAQAVLDYMLFNQAADSYRGVFGATHGRSYGQNVKYPDFEGTSGSSWVAFGLGSLTGGGGMAPVSLATSNYRLPKILADIATDEEAVIESKIRQGLFDYPVPYHADFTVYRTPDYMMCGLQDHHKGEFDPAVMVAQVTLPQKTVIFWSCPRTSSEGSGLRPDYWSGHTTLPRVIHHKNVMSLTWRLSNFAWMSHCFFEQARFDEVRFEGNWAFARLEGAYVGIYSENGLVVGAEGQYAGRELQCYAPENTWLVECGREADWGNFDAFVNALTSAQIESKDGALHYESPSVGRFVTGWDVTPTVDGEAIQLKDYPMVDSAWAYSKYGSGEMSITYGGETYNLWFNQ